MKNRSTGRLDGFTLIELLVVVLIIGILSAIALPQYRLAVEKARAAQAIVNVRSLADSVERYWLANGEYPRIEGSMYVEAEAINKLGLDIIVPDIKGFYYVFYNGIYVAAHTGEDNPIQYVISKTLKNQTREDWSKRGMTCNTESKSDGNTLSHRLCKSLCAASKLEEVWESGQYGCEIKS